MAFRYTLHPLLRLQQSLEKQEEQRLVALTSVVKGLRRQIETLDAAQTDGKRAALHSMANGATGAEIHFATVSDSATAEKRSELCADLKIAEEKKQEQIMIYRDARRRRETLASLRDHQRRAYDLEVSRTEQQRADEAFLIRRHSSSPE
jgi:flagellar export protein FliJ